MAQHVEVVGAYGRSYSTLKEMKADWDAGKDFRTTTGPYINKADAENFGVSVVGRYGRVGSGGIKTGTLKR